MKRLSFASPVSLALLVALACLLFSGRALATFVPPPLTGHVMTTAGWLAPADIRKLNDEAELVKTQTGYDIDVLLVRSLEGYSIDDVAKDTFEAWKPGDPQKDNGILMLFAPNFDAGERKARILVGTGVEAKLPKAKVNDILLKVIAPKVNGDLVRAAVAEGIAEIGKVLGADVMAPAGQDAGAHGPESAAPAAKDAGLGGVFLWAVGGFVALVLAYVGFMRLRGGKNPD